MCPPKFYKLLTTLCVVSNCAPPIKKSFPMPMSSVHCTTNPVLLHVLHPAILDIHKLHTFGTASPVLQVSLSMQMCLLREFMHWVLCYYICVHTTRTPKLVRWLQRQVTTLPLIAVSSHPSVVQFPRPPEIGGVEFTYRPHSQTLLQYSRSPHLYAGGAWE